MRTLDPIPYTALRVVDDGVVLYEFHRARMGDDAETLRAFEAFCSRATPGLYVLRGLGPGELSVTARPSSRLQDGQPTRTLVSPIAHRFGPQRKVPSPSPWDATRLDGVATLLTNAAGDEVFESCVASVLAWDGAQLVTPPDDRPRVASAFERWLVSTSGARPGPVRPGQPFLLANALAGPCVPRQPTPPPEPVVTALRAAWLATARRP